MTPGRIACLSAMTLGALACGSSPSVEQGTEADLRAAVAMGERCTDPEDGLLRHLTTVLAPAAHALATAPTVPDRLDLLVGLPKLGFGQGRKGNWVDDCIGEVRDATKAAEARRQQLLADARHQCLQAFSLHVGEFTVGSAERAPRIPALRKVA